MPTLQCPDDEMNLTTLSVVYLVIYSWNNTWQKTICGKKQSFWGSWSEVAYIERLKYHLTLGKKAKNIEGQVTFASVCTEQSLLIKEYTYNLPRNCENLLWCLKTCILLYALFDEAVYSQRLTVEWWVTNQPEKKREEITEACFEELMQQRKIYVS